MCIFFCILFYFCSENNININNNSNKNRTLAFSIFVYYFKKVSTIIVSNNIEKRKLLFNFYSIFVCVRFSVTFYIYFLLFNYPSFSTYLYQIIIYIQYWYLYVCVFCFSSLQKPFEQKKWNEIQIQKEE